MDHSIRLRLNDLLVNWCVPYANIDNNSYELLSDISLGNDYELSKLICSPLWINNDIGVIMDKNIYDGNDDLSALGNAFGEKYNNISFKDDARSLINDWGNDVLRALDHMNIDSLNGNLLHVGPEFVLEPHIFHECARSVTLIDISEKKLRLAPIISDKVNKFFAAAEDLSFLKSSSMDFYLALRVYSSYRFQAEPAIKEACRVLREGGSILLSIPNGYRAVDNTIMPGQIIDSPSRLSFTKPFEDALKILNLLSINNFHELFIEFGNAELFVGGVYLPSLRQVHNMSPIFHLGNFNHIPLCFYSDIMPTNWLGNYSNYPVVIDGIEWPTVEHYFQASKFKNPIHQQIIKEIKTPKEAKEYAWNNDIDVRYNWENVKVEVMRSSLDAKFRQNQCLKNRLILSNNRELIEKSPVDIFWGYNEFGDGNNMMGKLLMDLRSNLKTEVK